MAISVAPSPATSGTSLGVTDANAAFLPDQYPWYAVLVPTGTSPTRSNAEIVKVTGGSSSGGTTTYTITRAQCSPTTPAQTVTTSFDIYNAVAADTWGLTSFVQNETPSGTVNGSNVTFTLASTPVTGSLALYRDGQLMKGGGADYSLSGLTITFTTAPATDSVLLAFYTIVATTAGNADLVDGFHASQTAGDSIIPVLGADSNLPTGVVDTDSIEDSAVTAAKIANRTRGMVWVPATAWQIAENSPSLAAGGIDVMAHWLLDAAAIESVNTTVIMPDDYASGNITVKCYFAMASATSGNVQLHSRGLLVANNADTTGGGESQEDTVSVPGTAGLLKIHTFSTGYTGGVAGSLIKMCLRRIGSSGSDTATGDMKFFGMKLEYTADS